MSQAAQPSKLYQQARAIPLSVWTEAPDAELSALLSYASDDAPGLDAMRLTSLRLLGRVAHEQDEEAFADFLENGALPPMKLSSNEMEAVKGGGIGIGIVAGVFGALALIEIGSRGYAQWCVEDPTRPTCGA